MYNVGDKVQLIKGLNLNNEIVEILKKDKSEHGTVYKVNASSEKFWVNEKYIEKKIEFKIKENNEIKKEVLEVIKDKLNEYLKECYDECTGYSEEVIDIYMGLMKEFKKDENK